MKLFVFLGLLGSVAGAALAYLSHASLVDVRKEKDVLNREIVEIHKEMSEKAATITATNQSVTDTNTNAKNEALSTKSLLSEIKGKEAEVEAAKKETEEISGQKQKMQEEINRILGSTGTVEEIMAKSEQLKKDNDAKVEELDKISKEAEAAKKAIAESQNLITRLKQQQATRAKAISLASRTGTVSAVNPDFGFVIVNLGQNQGVSSESRLLVKRGSQLIGKLNIVQIEANTTVADIAVKTITPGFAIQPGDEVVFENSPT